MAIAKWRAEGTPDPNIQASLNAMPFVQQLQELRTKKGISLERVGQFINIDPRRLATIERGERPEGMSKLHFRGHLLAFAHHVGMPREEAEQKFYWTFGAASDDPWGEKRTKSDVSTLLKPKASLSFFMIVAAIAAVSFWVFV